MKSKMIVKSGPKRLILSLALLAMVGGASVKTAHAEEEAATAMITYPSGEPAGRAFDKLEDAKPVSADADETPMEARTAADKKISAKKPAAVCPPFSEADKSGYHKKVKHFDYDDEEGKVSEQGQGGHKAKKTIKVQWYTAISTPDCIKDAEVIIKKKRSAEAAQGQTLTEYFQMAADGSYHEVGTEHAGLSGPTTVEQVFLNEDGVRVKILVGSAAGQKLGALTIDGKGKAEESVPLTPSRS